MSVPSTTDVDQLRSEIRELREELISMRALRDDIHRLERTLRSSERTFTEPSVAAPIRKLDIFFDRLPGERKPYAVKIEGVLKATQKLSPIRTAILIVLLLDLQDRHEGGRGVIDPFDAIVRAYSMLESDTAIDEHLQNSIRVALYRFDIFMKESATFRGDDLALIFDSNHGRLALVDAEHNSITDPIQISVTTNDSAIAEVLDRILATSPLARVRKRKALYVPSGKENFDRLLLELYDHSYPVKSTVLYFRPSIQSYPHNVLDAIGVSEYMSIRKDIVFNAYQTGRCEVLEILNKQTIWDMIRYSPETGFKLYPRQITQPLVKDHLEHLIYKLQTFEHFSLALTDAAFPFHVHTFEIRSGDVPEYFSLFMRRFIKQFIHDVSCFVVNDPLVYQSIHEHIVGWILSHPSTVRERKHVIEEIRVVLRHLEEKGPIPFNPESSGDLLEM